MAFAIMDFVSMLFVAKHLVVSVIVLMRHANLDVLLDYPPLRIFCSSSSTLASMSTVQMVKTLASVPGAVESFTHVNMVMREPLAQIIAVASIGVRKIVIA